MRRALPIDRLGGLGLVPHGLPPAEVAVRRQRFGPNDIVEVTGNPWWTLLRDTAKDPMIWFLLTTSVLYGAMGDVVEALTVLGATVPLIGMDAWLHRRTQASTEGLSSRLASQATVVRGGVEVAITVRAPQSAPPASTAATSPSPPSESGISSTAASGAAARAPRAIAAAASTAVSVPLNSCGATTIRISAVPRRARSSGIAPPCRAGPPR